MTITDLLQQEHARLQALDDRAFLLELTSYLNVLTTRRRTRTIVEQLERETRERLTAFVAEQNDLIEEAKRIRVELAERAPEIDNSDMERPSLTSHERIRYDLDSFARFDELVNMDFQIGYPTLHKDDVEPEPVGTLLIILRGRLQAAQYGEGGSAAQGANRRPDLDDLWRPLHNLQERWDHSLRTFRQDSRTLPGLAHTRLRYFATELNPPPTIIESDEDAERLLEQSLQNIGSPKRVVQKVANGERLEDGETRWAEEVTGALKAELDRLHHELIKRLGLAPWWQRSLPAVIQHPIIAGVLGTVVGGIILWLLLG